MKLKKAQIINMTSTELHAHIFVGVEPWIGVALEDRLTDEAIVELTKHERFKLTHDWAWMVMAEWADQDVLDHTI